MGLLILWIMLAVVISMFCSLLETTLFSVRTSTLLERRAAGRAGAARLLHIKQNRIDDAISAILIVNTLAIAVGSTLAGAQAAQRFGGAQVGVASAVLTVLLLVVSEIIPKAMASRYAGSLSGAVGYSLALLIKLLLPVLVITRALIRLMARRPRERLTRREFALWVGAAPGEGAISPQESLVIGNLIYSHDLMLAEVMTPGPAVFMMGAEQTVADLIAAPGADAFSRIPLYRGDRRHVVGYVLHREVLKAYALELDGTRPLSAFMRQLPVLMGTERIGVAVGRILARREAVAAVADRGGSVLGLVTLEDLLEAGLGVEITDEPEDVAKLRPAVTRARRRRAARLRRRRQDGESPLDPDR